MNNAPLSHKIRCIASLCHLSGLGWLPITIPLLLQALPYTTLANSYWWGTALCAILAVSMLLAALCTILLWRSTFAIHPFIDQAGRSVTNLLLSGSLYLFVLGTFVGMTCGIQPLAPLAVIAFGLAAVVLFVAFILIVTGSVFTYQGQIYSYTLAIQFFHE